MSLSEGFNDIDIFLRIFWSDNNIKVIILNTMIFLKSIDLGLKLLENLKIDINSRFI